LNPIDLGATATPAQYCGVAMRLLRHGASDGVLVCICPTSITRISGIAEGLIGVAQETRNCRKPLIVQLQGGADCDGAIHHLRAAGIPSYPTAERAVAAFSALRAYSAMRERHPDFPVTRLKFQDAKRGALYA
jgi:acyl-CoA synthetase (NDP forming)